MEFIALGDVVRIGEKEYVFLHSTADFVYLAKILNVQETTQLDETYNREHKKKRFPVNSVVYSFVTLTTEEYNMRMAHFARPEFSVDTIVSDKVGKLNDEDVELVKKEMLSDRCPVPRVVKEYLKSL